MGIANIQHHQNAAASVNVMLNGGRVTRGFRDALFAAAGREGVSVNEFVLRAAGEKLTDAGDQFPGVFEAGDIDRRSNYPPEMQGM